MTGVCVGGGSGDHEEEAGVRARGSGTERSEVIDMEEAEPRSTFSGILYRSRRIGELIEEDKLLGHT